MSISVKWFAFEQDCVSLTLAVVQKIVSVVLTFGQRQSFKLKFGQKQSENVKF